MKFDPAILEAALDKHVVLFGMTGAGKTSVILTNEGAVVAQEPDAPPTGDAFRQAVLSKLDNPLQKILVPLLEAYPEPMIHDTVAEKAGYTPGSGTWNRYVSSLRSLELIEKRGDPQAQAWLFPDA